MQSQPAILGGPCARGKLGLCARGSRAHGVLQRHLPGQSVGTGFRRPVRTGSPGTSRVAAVVLRLGSRGLGVLVLLLGDAPELHGSGPLRT